MNTPRSLLCALIAVLGTGIACAQLTLPSAPPSARLVIPTAPAAPLTVDEAVAFALKYNPGIVRSQQDVTIAEYQVRSAQAGALPTLGLSANANWITSPPAPMQLPVGNGKTVEISTVQALSSSAQASLVQPVWPPQRWRAPVAAARANVGAAEETLNRTLEQTVFLTRQAFYQYATAQELVQVAQDAVNVAKGQLTLAQRNVEAGIAARIDVVQAEASVADAEVNLVRAKNNSDIARAGLALQLGLPAGTAVGIVAPKPGDLPAAPADTEALVATALKQRPDLQLINYRRAQVKANIDIIRLVQMPMFNLQANYTKNITQGGLFGTEGVTVVGVAQVNLYNGGKTQAEVAAAREQLAQLDTAAQQTTLGITFDVRQAWVNLVTAREQYKDAQRQFAAADEALRISRIRYENGMGIQLEVDQAQLRRNQAQVVLAQASLQAKVAAAQLDFAIGTPVPGETSVAPAGTAPVKQ
jgi:outer membrane protein TolC